jgi:hypothetical protein
MDNNCYFEHEDKVINEDNRFKRVMAITLDKNSNYKKGLVRCITSRDGNVDRSQLFKVEGDSLDHFEILDILNIKNETEIINNLTDKGWDFIGLEDPDIWYDEINNHYHIYFTIPIRPLSKEKGQKIKIHLGHAQGRSLDSLEMTQPVLFANEKFSAKEVSIAPINKRGFRYNLVESRDRQESTTYSVIQVAIAEDMGETWKYGDIVFHPQKHSIPWIAAHASPGPLFPKDFIDVGEGKMLGIINGREADNKIGEKVIYGTFSIGLFIYDYEYGKIDWVSPEPFIRDSEAKTITFASQFVQTNKSEGILYAHVDDSFVRAYTLNAAKIKEYLLKNV